MFPEPPPAETLDDSRPRRQARRRSPAKSGKKATWRPTKHRSACRESPARRGHRRPGTSGEGSSRSKQAKLATTSQASSKSMTRGCKVVVDKQVVKAQVAVANAQSVH